MKSTKAFDFDAMGIAGVLKSYKLAVPLYQREYAWQKAQVERLYGDLSYAKRQGEYFLGTIVTIPVRDVLEVVDGQQRLTTTALLLAAMRDYLLSIEGADIIVQAIETNYLTMIDRHARDTVPRLRLNVDDHEFFVALIARHGPTNSPAPRRDSHHRLLTAAQIARGHVKALVSQFPKESHADELNGWLDFLETDASVILLKAPNGDQAFRMFETLNDRGMKTTQVDLVKSYLFGQAVSRLAEAQSKWSSTQALLEEIEDEDRSINFLRHLLIATRKFIRANDIFATVQSPIRGEASALAFLSEMESLARVYVGTFRTDADVWNGYPKSATDALRAINRFDIKPLRPLLLAIAARFTMREASAAFAFLVSLSVRLLIAATTRSGSTEEALAQAALEVYQGKITNVKELKSRLAAITPDNTEFEEAFATTSSTKPDYARYYLRTLERSLRSESEPWHVENDDPASITLEHILPKSPGPGWGEWQDAEQVKKYVRRLGNMCLLQRTANSNLKSDAFDIKRRAFRDAPYSFTSHIADYEKWTPDEIEERQSRMAKQAVLAWPI